MAGSADFFFYFFSFETIAEEKILLSSLNRKIKECSVLPQFKAQKTDLYLYGDVIKIVIHI